MHWLSEHRTDGLSTVGPWLIRIIPSLSVIVGSIRPEISDWSISWRRLVTGLPVRDFLKSCSDGRPTLKVLTATSSKSPSILLNISQYLSKYAFTDFPSLIDIDNKESRGWGTLLHVMNREQNDWVSFLKELIELVLSPSNHLIGIDPKLDGKTLHNKASSWEWIAIFCLN